MINQSSRDLRSQVVELKHQLVIAIADEQRLYQRYSEAGREAERWRRRADLAAGKGADDLARAALERSNKHGAAASQFYQQYLEQKGYVERMKIRLLEVERQVRMRITTAARPLDTERLQRRLARVERWEERAREERARLAALAELERDQVAERLAELERQDQLERQLAELKRRLGRGQGPGASDQETDTRHLAPDTQQGR